MILSKACEYGIRAGLFVAGQKNKEFVPIREIGTALGISHHFLTKVLQDLTRAHIMRSLRGPNGGVALNNSPESISLYDIVLAIDGPSRFDSCLLGLPSCDDSHPCPLHHYWDEVRDGVRKKFTDISLKALSDRVADEGLRISSLL